MGETTHFGGGSSRGSGYLTYQQPVGACVLVLHEFFGLTPSFLRYADRLKDERFTALVPDIYEGAVASSVEEATQMARSLDAERTLRILAEAVEHMRTNWHPRVGVVGFSLGAGLAVELAKQTQVDAVVTYYGVSEIDPNTWDTPLVVHAAEKDEWDSVEDLRQFAAGAPDEFHVYDGCGHWFANEDVPDAYNEKAARLAFERTTDFLSHHLA